MKAPIGRGREDVRFGVEANLARREGVRRHIRRGVGIQAEMDDVFHEGELEIQRRAGLSDEAEAVGRTIASRVSPAAARFLSRQCLAVASSVDDRGFVWASPLAGAPGFVSAADQELLRIAAAPVAGDPLERNLASQGPLGLLVFDARTRQRMRFNGRGLRTPDGLFLLVEQAYGNCPKYIQLRQELPEGTETAQAPLVKDHLDAGQAAWVARSDTFFLASFHPRKGADASHRGGPPGFVRVSGPRRLSFPDFSGNAMFNTLGNLLVHPRAGLLLVDFERGDTLQLTGRARVDGGTRTVILEMDEVRETPRAVRLRLRSVTPGEEAASQGPRR